MWLSAAHIGIRCGPDGLPPDLVGPSMWLLHHDPHHDPTPNPITRAHPPTALGRQVHQTSHARAISAGLMDYFLHNDPDRDSSFFARYAMYSVLRLLPRRGTTSPYALLCVKLRYSCVCYGNQSPIEPDALPKISRPKPKHVMRKAELRSGPGDHGSPASGRSGGRWSARSASQRPRPGRPWRGPRTGRRHR